MKAFPPLFSGNGRTRSIRLERYRELRGIVTVKTHWYLSSIEASASELGRRIRGHWGVENQVHYPKDVTFGEDRSRIRTLPLVQVWSVARSFALNLYRSLLMANRAQAQRRCMFGLSTLKILFRMK
ncbi:ISAs1 family transposase [Gloeobacter violaceus]|uniref:Gll2006 protein n=1 Tax=Gloeobacter violaceus (strain ATCC 29082 / PCC 7421) TaxID=251221 RepID=Q7NJ26_GLOVI|nr:gll2006 [Gloeobacter violaceus PCC 7421]